MFEKRIKRSTIRAGLGGHCWWLWKRTERRSLGVASQGTTREAFLSQCWVQGGTSWDACWPALVKDSHCCERRKTASKAGSATRDGRQQLQMLEISVQSNSLFSSTYFCTFASWRSNSISSLDFYVPEIQKYWNAVKESIYFSWDKLCQRA